MLRPTLSVCLICYNQALYIRSAIDSILNQSISFTWEIIVADDFSTDGTREILLEYANAHPKIFRLLLQSENVGPSRNYLDLLNAVNGEYIAYLEGDDYWTDENKLQLQIDFLVANTNYVACFHNVSILENGLIKGSAYSSARKKVVTFGDLANGDYLKSCSLVFRNKKEMEMRPLLDGLIPAEDTSLGLCLLQFSMAYYLEKNMAVYRVHNSGTFSKINEVKKWIWAIETQEKLIQYFSKRPEVSSLKRVYSEYCLNLSKAYLNESKYLKFFQTYFHAVISSIFTGQSIRKIIQPLYILNKKIVSNFVRHSRLRYW